jgi:hypothetical protein
LRTKEGWGRSAWARQDRASGILKNIRDPIPVEAQRRLTPATQLVLVLVLVLEARWLGHARPEYEYEYRFAEYEYEILCATR